MSKLLTAMPWYFDRSRPTVHQLLQNLIPRRPFDSKRKHVRKVLLPLILGRGDYLAVKGRIRTLTVGEVNAIGGALGILRVGY